MSFLYFFFHDVWLLSQLCDTIQSIVLFICQVFNHMAGNRCITTRDVNLICDAAAVPPSCRDDWQFDRVSLYDRDTPQQQRKAHYSFRVLSGRWLRFTSCCFEWQALEHLSALLLRTQTVENDQVCHVVSDQRYQSTHLQRKWIWHRTLRHSPNLYFSLASALSLASKYQTVMA